MKGGIVYAYGGRYGAGIGNSLHPNLFSVYVKGGMTYAYAGLGLKENTQIDAGYIENKEEFAGLQVQDVSADKLVITGGHFQAEDFVKSPVNAKGEKLYCYLIPCSTGTVNKFTYDGGSYVCDGIVSKGYLSIWLNAFEINNIRLTVNEHVSEIEHYTSGLRSEDILDGASFDLSKGSIELLSEGCIYNNQLYSKQIPWEGAELTLTNTTAENQVMISSSGYDIHLSGVNGETGKNGLPFMMLGNNVDTTILLKGENSITAKFKACALLQGYGSSLNLYGSEKSDVLILNAETGGTGILVKDSEFNQYGGSLQVQLAKKSIGINLGTHAQYTLGGGSFTSDSDQGVALAPESDTAVKIYGGKMDVYNMGYDTIERYNGDLVENAVCFMSAGEVTVRNQISFDNFIIYGGNVVTHEMGNIAGSKLFQYDGTITLDIFNSYDGPYEFNGTYEGPRKWQ